MDVHTAPEVDPHEWDDLVRQDDQATFFHTSGWIDLLTSVFAGRRAIYVLGRSGERLVAGIPLVRRSVLGVTVLESMPYGTFGGLVLRTEAPEHAPSALGDAFGAIARRAGVAAAHLVDLPGRFSDALPGFRVIDDEIQVVRLDRSYEDVLAGFKPSARNKTRKAESEGVRVRRGTSEADFLTYHEILVECSERWGSAPGFGRGFFSRLSEQSADLVQLWLADHEGRTIAGDLNFVLHGTIINWGNVSRNDALRLAPNNLLHATAMEEGVRAGCSLYNLGSSAGIEGVDAFKSSFGTERIKFRRYSLERPWYRAVRKLLRRGG